MTEVSMAGAKSKGVPARQLLAQISGDLDPTSFTLAEVKEEYAAVSRKGSGIPVYYERCFQLLEEGGFIATNDDGSYRIISE